MFCTGIKISFLEPEPVGAELLRVEPVPIFLIWSWIRKKKISGAGAAEKWLGSARLILL